MFSLSKSIQAGPDGSILDPTYETLRNAIVNRGAALYKELGKWFKAEAYEDSTKTPVEFVNKVRTPCGQFTNKDKCNKSSLCGWHKNTCKIRVKPVVEKDTVLKRMVKTLRDNDKQRSLVLDNRLSPFFSTVLYLEMPNELITTAV
jgi:type IV secretory pathway VirB9-like protein